MPTYDVIVLGLGGMGSAAAYHLAARGRRVLGLEQFTPAHDRGSSHGQTRIIREAYAEGPAYVPLVRRAYELWQALERTTDTPLLQITGGLMIGHPDTAFLQGVQASVQRHHLPHEVLSAEDLRRRYPVLRPLPDEIAIWEPRAGFLRPEACIQAHLAAAQRHGAALHFEEPVQRWRATDAGVEVVTARGRYQAERLVITAGAWLGALVAELAPHLRVERQPVFWFAPTELIEAWEPERFPIWIWQRRDQPTLYGFPRIDGLVKAGIHHTGQWTTADSVERAVAPAEGDELRRLLAARFRGLDTPPARAGVCLYTNSPDEHFIIDRHPAHAQVVVAAACSGHGFKFCSVVGELLADLTTDASAQPLDLFRWERLRGKAHRA
ncbi:N-methyl-L-tryptophan oxidase [Kallotenue papyrolyticum]|uniref:N-methyl-L-tryptophan oxidase n=1 Tax=Kallotenue papyrolyticum TaxID=1325125 RepID=UPI000492B347|nr:N-methyl-L-tryptophan oxidase [Kallotenue papyrolyticum]